MEGGVRAIPTKRQQGKEDGESLVSNNKKDNDIQTVIRADASHEKLQVIDEEAALEGSSSINLAFQCSSSAVGGDGASVYEMDSASVVW